MNILKIKLITTTLTIFVLFATTSLTFGQGLNYNASALWIQDADGNNIQYSSTDNPWNNYTNFVVGGNNIMHLRENGKVIIGSNPWTLPKVGGTGLEISSSEYKLFVESGIITEKCKVAVKSTGYWSDYVFEEDYEMMEIEELEDYVTKNKHLPNVPSAEEVVKNGLDVATMDAKLLEKIEEAYLYIIDMNKEMKTMNEKVDALANENGALKASLSAISTSAK